MLVLVTKDAKIKPNKRAISVAKKETIKEFLRGIQKIFSLTDEVKNLSIYL